MSTTITNFDSSVLLGYYQARTDAAVARNTNGQTKTSSNTSTPLNYKETAKDVQPWSQKSPSQLARDSDVLALKKYIDTSDIPTGAGTTAGSKLEQDNQKLFAIYKALDNLRYLTSMAQRKDTSAAQMAGYNKRFEAGLAEVQSYLKSTTFNTYSLQAASPSASVTSSAKVKNATFTYTGGSIVTYDDLKSAVKGVSSTDSFDITVTKGGVATKVAIDLSKISDTLTLDNIVTYANQQLSDAGFSSRLKRVMTEGSVAELDEASFGLQLSQGAGEKLAFSSASATPSLYLATTTGLTKSSGDTDANNQGRLLKLSDITNPSGPTATFSESVTPTDGTTTAQATVVDSNGNVYMVGNATGDFGSQLNQGTQDAYLSKYDSAGNLLWTQLLGSAGTANGWSLAVNPQGGVVIAGSTTADVVQNSTANGNKDSFVAAYGADGTEKWVRQFNTLNQNQANAVSVDQSGNVYISGQARGALSSTQTAQGGQDAYVAKFDATGKLVAQKQFGTAGTDNVAATAMTASGDLLVATVENGEAYLSKYTGGDLTQAAAWKLDVGTLASTGSLSGLAVASDGSIYLSGTNDGSGLNATAVNPAVGSNDAFVMKVTDAGASATADHVSYVGTSGQETGGSLTTDGAGNVYLVGSTTGTFAGNTRTTANVNNSFVAALSSDGSVNWVKQYGGAHGQSTGQGIAVDTQGSSVLDALGLPRGTLQLQQSTSLASATTLRAGDSFKIEIEGTAKRTFTVTIDKNETLQSLATKIESQFGGKGTASVAYAAGGKGLRITVKDGVTAKLISGPADSDALARLGISPGLITAAGKSSSTSKSTSSSADSTSQAFGLGLSSNLDISTASGASHAYANLTAALSAIKNVYRTTNTTGSSSNSSSSTSGADAVTQAKLSNYNAALSLLDSYQFASSGTSGLFG